MQLQDLALLLSSVADTIDLQCLGVAVGNTDNHIVNQCSGQAVKCLFFLLIVGSYNAELTVLLLELHLCGKSSGKCSLRPLNRHCVIFCYINSNACRYSDWH